jgi:capsular exopolysaccharide synthesis family protein
MSKHFSLLQEEQREGQATDSISRPNTLAFPTSELDRTARFGSQDFDRIAQEECMKLVQRVFLGQPAKACRTIVFAGVDPGNGCSRICIEAARILAANVSGSVCLVDGNFRTPSLHRFFGIPEDGGLADSLLGQDEIRSFARELTPSNLWLITAGALSPESPSLLNSERLNLRIDELRSEFNYVLVDVPALNLYSDAIALSRLADGLVLVLQADSTRRESALKSLENLRVAQVEVLGAVLNRRTFPIPNFVYRRL